MATIVYQTDKRSGITYAYQSISHWDKEKKQSCAKRGPKKAELAHRSFYGATYLLDAIGEQLGIIHDLKQCFSDTYKQILFIAYYLILEDSTPLYRFEKWGILHKHPYGKNITSQRSSELFASITEESLNKGFSPFREKEDCKQSSGPMIQLACPAT